MASGDIPLLVTANSITLALWALTGLSALSELMAVAACEHVEPLSLLIRFETNKRPPLALTSQKRKWKNNLSPASHRTEVLPKVSWAFDGVRFDPTTS
jgi:hypothetical protein